MSSHPFPTPTETLSIREARSLVKDLFQPSPKIFWTDFLVTMAIGGTAFGLISRTPRWSIWQLLAFVVCAAAYYRATIFTHELVHLPAGRWKAFRATWNLLCGIPFLMPSFTYYTHIDHHRRKHYGTRRDGEYIPLGSMPPYKIALYLSQALVAGPLAVIRFGLITPLSWFSPRIRDLAAKHASSMVMDPTYIRPLPPRRVRFVWRLQEALCFAWIVGVVVVIFRGIIPITGTPLPADFIPKCYLLSVAIILVNSVRTLASHRFYGANEEEMSFTEQLVDSVNHPDKAWLGGLWAPLGQRFHALHHLFPTIPYHNLAEAHARLMAGLAERSPYRLTISPGLLATLRQLWANSRAASQVTPTLPMPRENFESQEPGEQRLAV